MRAARIDPALSVQILRARALRYDRPAGPADDRPDHVRAASGLAIQSGTLVVAQDDASFLGLVDAEGVSAVKLPRGLDGRRRFETAIGNRLDKLDLESCVAIDDELWAFGSGSLPIREKICRVQHGHPRVLDAEPLYARLRDALDGPINLEGAARVNRELWLFHRGNSGAGDLGPAVVRVDIDDVRAWLDARAGLPPVLGVERFDLGGYGFTDAAGAGDRVFYLAARESSANAIDDGEILGSQLGVIARDGVRAAPLALDGEPVKAEGLALDPARPGRAWIVLDPDDPDAPATLLDVALAGPW